MGALGRIPTSCVPLLAVATENKKTPLMSDIIKILPAKLSNQIAAGEVIQRPASALKELIENSIDAGAKQIDIFVEDAGKTSLRIIDNGHGMSSPDARICFAQHATSKIHTHEDLQRISTFGFRGEALAAISAISQVELRTRRESDELGTYAVVDKGKLTRQQQVQMQVGTQFVVRHLFFNVPARRKFLRSYSTEMRHLLQVFQQAAISQPEVGFTLHSQGKSSSSKPPLYQLPATHPQARIQALLGKQYSKQLLPVNTKHPSLHIYGYIGKPEAAKKKSGEQWLFVNSRYVRSRLLSHAITQAYEALITSDRYPFFMVCMDVDPLRLDVNIHPAKTEVKFEEESTVYSLLHAATKKALGTYQAGGEIDFKLDTNFEKHMRTSDRKSQISATVAAHKWQALQQAATLEAEHNLSPYDFSRDKILPSQPTRQLHVSTDKKQSTTFSRVEKVDASSGAVSSHKKEMSREDCPSYPFFLLHGRYLCKPLRSNLLLIDSRRAQERILYERFAAQRGNETASQKLLFSENLPFATADLELFSAASTLLQQAGFLYEVKEEALEVSGLPAGLIATELAPLFETLLQALQEEYTPDTKHSQKPFWQLAASRIAARQPPLRTEEEMKALVDTLYACKQPNYTPRGEKISRHLDPDTLEQLLKT